MTLAPVGSDGVDAAPAHVDAPLGKRLEHPPAERVVANDPDERHPEPETRGAARGDRRRAADGQSDPVDEPLDLAERRLDVIAGDDDVRVELPGDEEVELAARLRARHSGLRVVAVPVGAMCASRSVGDRSSQGRPCASIVVTSR